MSIVWQTKLPSGATFTMCPSAIADGAEIVEAYQYLPAAPTARTNNDKIVRNFSNEQRIRNAKGPSLYASRFKVSK